MSQAGHTKRERERERGREGGRERERERGREGEGERGRERGGGGRGRERESHPLSVLLQITSEFNQRPSAWQTANSFLFRPEKKIRPVLTEQATRSECLSWPNIFDLES